MIPFSFIKSAYDPSAQAFFDANQTAGFPVDTTNKVKINALVLSLKASGDWAVLDSLYIWSLSDKEWAKRDLRTPSRTVTLQGSYAGEWTTLEGWKGNGLNAGFGVLTNFNPGDGGTYNFTQNSASYGILMLDNDSAASKQEVSCCNAGFTAGILMHGFNPTDRASLNTIIAPTNSYTKYRFNSYCWKGVNRTSSTLANVYVNGVNTQTQTSATAALENKAIAIMGAYNGAWSANFYTLNSHAVFYAGGGTVSQKNIMNAYNAAFAYGNVTNITKRITFEGDSRTGSAGSASLSNSSAYPKAVLTGLGSGWSGTLVSEANETIQSMVTQAATEIDPYRNTSLVKDVCYLFAGTNDIAGGRSAAQVYADIVTWATARKALGFKVVIFGEIDRNWSSYAAMNTIRATLRTSMLTDFPTTAGTNIYSGAAYADYYVDLYSEATFQSYLSADYQADGIHPDASGSALIATYGVAVGNLL